MPSYLFSGTELIWSLSKNQPILITILTFIIYYSIINFELLLTYYIQSKPKNKKLFKSKNGIGNL